MRRSAFVFLCAFMAATKMVRKLDEYVDVEEVGHGGSKL
jgi:hypothetical protein